MPFLENLAFLFCNEVSSVLTGIVSGVGLRCRNIEIYLYYVNLLVLDVGKSYFRDSLAHVTPYPNANWS